MMAGIDSKPVNQPRLTVWAGAQRVGDVIFQKPGTCQLHYDQSWQQQGFSLSPHLPFDQPCRALATTNFIRNLFPEGGAFETLLATEHLSKNNLYGILATIGADTAGALTFAQEQVQQQSESALRQVNQYEIIERLRHNRSLAVWDDKYRLSLAGVQNKLNVLCRADGSLYLADGQYASTHILKFASEQYPSIVLNEYYCMRLARAVGLPTAEVEIQHFGVYPALLVKRFDRQVTEHKVAKRHVIDGCQALNMSPDYKYEQNFGSGRDVAAIRDGVSIKKLYQFLAITSVPALARQQLIDWVLFNIIIGNSDAHGKNVSFYYGKEGPRLTPFYDMVSVGFEALQNDSLDTSLAMAIGDNFNQDQLTAYDLLSMADELGINFDYLKRRINRLTGLVDNHCGTLELAAETLNEAEQQKLVELVDFVAERNQALRAQIAEFNVVIKTAFE
ncbi:HipA domain-containing protein [Idiomarina seosinensis]|uniref:HipA domain-containing protein n=1 Tax=Idiomarina seosinensis TaxID=281739 RepID=UPI00384E98D0